ncbi:MAG: hypothetical protein VST70_09860 [Nitrospirota bacterium]|nr:hypothetical protein [Nitrospirota bacterium]
MGRTLDTFTTKIDQTRSEWSLFRRALRREDQILFDALFGAPRIHAQAGAYLSPADPFPVMLVCMLMEERKSRIALEERLHDLEQRLP